MTPFILSGYLFNTILYFTTYALLPPTLIPNAIYCPKNNSTTTNCDRRDLFAFQIVSLLNLSFLGLLGFYTFYISRHASKKLPHTTVGRFFGNYNSSVGGGGGQQAVVVLLPEADYINSVIVIFQGWDFVASLFFEEHCTMIMMSHHTLAFICGYFCLVYEVNPYYAVYFGGVSEFSSIFLCISQLFQYYPPSSFGISSTSPILHTLESFSQAMFVLTFFAFRIVGWAIYGYMFVKDGMNILRNGLLQKFAPGSTWFLLYLMSMVPLLGALQLYWLGGIMEKLTEIHG